MGDLADQTAAGVSALTDTQKVECLALAEMMERVKKTDGGVKFLTAIFMAWAVKAGMHVLPIENWRKTRTLVIELHVAGILSEGISLCLLSA